MTHPPYLREKARQLRTERKMSLDEIAECLALGKTTVWYWIKDLPDPEIKHRETPARRRSRAAAAAANRQRFKALRDSAYQEGLATFAALDARPGFRDFICMYIGEGYKRDRNTVSLANSDPSVIGLANYWIEKLSTNKVSYTFQYHADQDPLELTAFWAATLGVDASRITAFRKKNSGQLSFRNWRCKHGVLSIRTGDTYLRARLQAWIDRVKESWLDSISGRGV